MCKTVFKVLSSNPGVLFPANLLDSISAIHPVLVVNQAIDRLNIGCLLSMHKGDGTSAYHPTHVAESSVGSCLNNIYSCRKTAKALQENIHFMWLLGNSCPDFRIITVFVAKA